MVVLITGVMKLVPVPKTCPPVAAAYQLIVPSDAPAPSVTCPLPHTLPGVVPVMAGIGVTVTVTDVLAELEQPDAFNDAA